MIQHPRRLSQHLDDTCRLEDVYEPDDSITNGSSLSLLIEAGQLRLLFLGDCWAEDCIQALRAIPASTTPMFFDAIKLSHQRRREEHESRLLADGRFAAVSCFKPTARVTVIQVTRC